MKIETIPKGSPESQNKDEMIKEGLIEQEESRPEEQSNLVNAEQGELIKKESFRAWRIGGNYIEVKDAENIKSIVENSFRTVDDVDGYRKIEFILDQALLDEEGVENFGIAEQSGYMSSPKERYDIYDIHTGNVIATVKSKGGIDYNNTQFSYEPEKNSWEYEDGTADFEEEEEFNHILSEVENKRRIENETRIEKFLSFIRKNPDLLPEEVCIMAGYKNDNKTVYNLGSHQPRLSYDEWGVKNASYRNSYYAGGALVDAGDDCSFDDLQYERKSSDLPFAGDTIHDTVSFVFPLNCKKLILTRYSKSERQNNYGHEEKEIYVRTYEDFIREAKLPDLKD